MKYLFWIVVILAALTCNRAPTITVEACEARVEQVKAEGRAKVDRLKTEGQAYIVAVKQQVEGQFKNVRGLMDECTNGWEETVMLFERCRGALQQCQGVRPK